MSELEAQFVKRGLWTNWSQGAVMGQTLTINSSAANVVVALLAICTSIGTAQLFNLIVFLYHQCRAHGRPSDGLYWQQQALLRTLPTPTALVADYVKLWWSWRAKSKRALVRSWLTTVLVFCYAIAAIAAGISTSYAVDTTNLEVLVDSPYCRLVNVPNLAADTNASTAFATGIIPYVHTYTQNCYKNVSVPAVTCRNIFIQPKISLTVEPASCPWQSSLCLEGDRPAVAMDSGLLDVGKEFGMNLKAADNLWVRRRTTCNVLPLAGRGEQFNLSSATNPTLQYQTIPGEQGIGYVFGNYTDADPDTFPQYLHKISTLTANRTKKYNSIGIITRSHTNSFMWGANWRTLEEMNRTDADVAISFIDLNNVLYHRPVNDPLFSAHREASNGGLGELKRTEYKSDALVGALGCAVQHQFCASQSGGDRTCTPLSGLPADDASLVKQFAGLTGVQTSLLKLLWAVSFLNDVTNAASTEELLVAGLNMNGLVGELPDDQWTQEIINWENYAWAGFQTMFSDTAVGPITRNKLADSYTDAPVTDGDKMLCGSMKMRKAGGFANVNMFGLVFIITFSAVISFINFFILRFFIFLKRFRKSLAPRLDRWVNDGIYQLQRRAFEAEEDRLWAHWDREIPITLQDAALRELPATNRVFRRSGTATTLVEKNAPSKWGLPITTELHRSFSEEPNPSPAGRDSMWREKASPVERSTHGNE